MEVFKRFRPGHELVISRFEWDIQVPFLQTADGQGKGLDCGFFSPKQTPDRKWKVSVNDIITHLRIFLIHYDSANKRVNIDDPILVKMWIPNEKGDKCIQQSLTPSPTIDCVPFQLSKEEIVKSGCQQVNGSLTFCWKIYAHKKKVAVSPAVPLGFIDCSAGLVDHLEQLFDKMPFSDVTFTIGGREFPAHKNILAARNEYFAGMFNGPEYRENLSGLVEIKDDEPEVFEKLLQFLYTGRLDSTTMEKMAANLFILADKYLIDELKSECLKYLLLHMSPKNCVLLLHGDLQNPAEYLKKAAKFFRHFPGEAMATDEWKKMKKENPTLLFNILEFVYPCK